MRNMVLAVLGIMVSCGTLSAAPELPLQAFASEKSFQSTKCNAAGCLEIFKARSVLVHAFKVDPAIISSLNRDSRILVVYDINNYLLRLGDDPNYYPGARSATIKQFKTLGLAPAIMTVKAEWDGDTMRVFVAGTGNSTNISSKKAASSIKEKSVTIEIVTTINQESRNEANLAANTAFWHHTGSNPLGDQVSQTYRSVMTK